MVLECSAKHTRALSYGYILCKIGTYIEYVDEQLCGAGVFADSHLYGGNSYLLILYSV